MGSWQGVPFPLGLRAVSAPFVCPEQDPRQCGPRRVPCGQVKAWSGAGLGCEWSLEMVNRLLDREVQRDSLV